MIDQVFALTGWIVAFAAVTGAVIAGIARFIRRDSVEYDTEFLWEERNTLEEMELKNPNNPRRSAGHEISPKD